MNRRVLDRAISLGQKLRHIIVATADWAVLPHRVAAAKMSFLKEVRGAVAAWLCPGIMAISRNRKGSLAIWAPRESLGFGLQGESERVQYLAMMNGYIPGEERTLRFPS